METIKKHLVEGEQVLQISYIHPAIFLHPGLILFLAFLAGVFFHPILGVAVCVLALYPSINAIIQFKTMRLVLTNKRVFGRSGFFNRDQAQFKLDRIESAYLEEPILGRLLGYSTVVVKGTGTGNLAVTYVADGEVFVKKLEALTLNTPAEVRNVGAGPNKSAAAEG
jgi:uncharacterized membrane protein YdbT with pleckstrin-like domain